MELAITLCGFAGAWLLVVGPVYQASLELRAEDLENERLHDLMAALPAPPAPSRWWWLLPPVLLVLQRRRRETMQQQLVEQLPDSEYEVLKDFLNKAVGWLLVGVGGLLIATKESYELVEVLEWPLPALAAVVAGMLLLSVGYVAGRGRHDQDVATRRSAAGTGSRATADGGAHR